MRMSEKLTQATYPKIGCGGHVGYCIDVHPDNPSGWELSYMRDGYRPWHHLPEHEGGMVIDFCRRNLRKDFDFSMVWWRYTADVGWQHVDPRVRIKAVGKWNPRVNDIIVVARQPSNQCAQLEGERGYIDEISADGLTAGIRTFDRHGKSLGMGSVPVDCLEREVAPDWAHAKAVLDERQAAYERRVLAYNERYQEEVKRLAKKYKVSATKVRLIHGAIEEWRRNQH
jgi:hypothetical protein